MKDAIGGRWNMIRPMDRGEGAAQKHRGRLSAPAAHVSALTAPAYSSTLTILRIAPVGSSRSSPAPKGTPVVLARK